MVLIRVSTLLSLRFCSRKAFHSKCVSSKQGREDTSERLILKASHRGESRKFPEWKESILHKLILTGLCLFKPICGTFEAEEKNSRREGLLCRARGTNVVTKSCKVTAGYVTMSDYNLVMSFEMRLLIRHDHRTNHIAKTVILRLKICTIITVRILKSGHLEEDYQIATFFENKRFSSCLLVHKFKGCFLRGQVSSNGFKVFNGYIVEP